LEYKIKFASIVAHTIRTHWNVDSIIV